MSDTKPICPVCGREMVWDGQFMYRWECGHNGNLIKGNGWFLGPNGDRDGSKIRAQIAAMDQRALANALGIIDRDMQGLPLPGAIERALEQHAGATETLPTTPPTCGQCAWRGVDQTAEGAEYPACDNPACTRVSALSHYPACPAFVQAERSEK